jgi:hypothetical protein
VIDDRGPLVIGQRERIAGERLRQDRCADKPWVMA